MLPAKPISSCTGMALKFAGISGCLPCGPSLEEQGAPSSESSASGSESDSESSGESGSEASSESGSGEGSDSEEAPELAVDQHGRVVAQISAKSFRFRSFSRLFSEQTAPSLRADCCAAARSVHQVKSAEYSEGQTFWIGAGDAPRCSLERAALEIFRFHTGVDGCTFDASRSGAEWWSLAMDAESSQVAWHWDKDYSLEHGGINISPHLATVTYLSDVGAPTLMVDKTCSTDYSANISGEANVALLSRPQYGKHVVFDGRYLHAAPSELSLWASDSSGGDGVEGEAGAVAAAARPKRVSFLVNLWLNWKPADAVRCPEAVLAQLGTAAAAVPLCFDNELTPIPTVPSAAIDPGQTTPAAAADTDAAPNSGAARPSDGGGGSADTTKWQFEAGKQTAVMTFTAPLESIRQAGAHSGASLLLRSGSAEGEPNGGNCPPLVRVEAKRRPKKRKKGRENASAPAAKAGRRKEGREAPACPSREDCPRPKKL